MRHARLFRKLGFALLLSALLLLEDLEVLKAKDLIGDGDLTVSDGSWGKVYGMQRQPQSGDAQTENAHLTINGGAVSSSIYGGYARSNDGAARAGGNEVTITGIKGSPGTLYGGYARSASNAVAAGNRLTISGAPSFSDSSAYGGRADASGGTSGLYLATNNHVTIDITTSLYQVFGGSISAASNDTADVGSYGNEVTIRQGTIEEVYGGRASGSGMVDVSGNRISISDGSVTQIIGGNAYSKHQIAVADDNAIIITGGTHENIIAASVQSDSMQVSASNNAVYLSNTTVKGVTGGYSTSTDTAASLNYNSIVVGAEAVVTSNVHGGDAIGTGDGNSAAHNSISVVQGGQIHGELVGGNLKGAGDVSYNTIQISNGSVGSTVSGGRTAGDGSANNNSISVENGSVGGNLVAGNVGGKGDVSNNTIQISGGNVTGNVSGGNTAGDGIAGGNSITVSNGGTISGSLVAGDVGGKGDVSNNTIQIDNASVTGDVSGGQTAGDGSASGNSISVSNGGTISGNLVAGDVGGTGDVSKNTIQIDNASVTGHVSGGQTAGDGIASGNSITVNNGGTISGNLVAGDVGGTGDVSNNTIQIDNASVTGDVSGGQTAGDGSASGNTISISNGGTISGDLVAGDVGGTGDVSKNTIQINNASVTGHVSGGQTAGDGIASGNSISVSNGGTLSGNLVAGDIGGTGDVSNNTIQISGGKVDGNVSGGQAAKGGSADHNTIAIVQGGSVTGDLLGGDLGGAGSASHNTILVNNGSAGGDIIGGRTAAGGSATGNSIILGQQAQLAPTSNLFGGIVGEQAVAPQGSGNTLFVDSWQGTVERAAGFANLHFVLPTPGTPAADVPMLTVTNAQQGDFKGTTVTAQLPDIITGGSAHIGETFVLVKDGSGAINEADIGGLVGLLHGYATIYDGVIFDENNSIVIRVEDARANPLASALTEARIGAAGLLNQGGDLIAGSALRAADTAARETRGWAAFATLSGGAASLTTETDVTTRGLSLVAGLARHDEAAWADTLLGAFFETGYGNLVTAREAAGEIVKGYGYTRYTGGGLLARLDITQGFLRGLYLEASGRAGEITTTWSSDDLLDNMDRPAEYDLTTPYYGGHAGLGYLLPLNETWTLDLYGKYLFAHQEGQDTTINGDSFHFDAVDSGRLRCGTRLSGTVSPSGSVYLGAAWEQEVYGTARAASRSSNMSVPSTAMTGSSALFELGFTVTPEQSPLRLDMALEGSAGTRRSIGGHVHMVYEF